MLGAGDWIAGCVLSVEREREQELMANLIDFFNFYFFIFNYITTPWSLSSA